MDENGGIEIVASGDALAEIPNMKTDDSIVEENEKQEKTLNRSSSCGSILQGNGMNKMKNLSRRVSFPSDDKLISGYNEPKNPWEHAHETTTEDLIQAYTQACQQWNVRPITKLLLQLQEITDFTVRANSLTLKGEKLEMRVVETLESIFKRVQFITIDLEATNLDEDAGASLFDMIEYYESAVNVLVGFNKNLGNRGWQAAAHMMRKMSCLRLFDGHSVPLSIQASPFVGRALRLSNTLVTLHLENATLSGRPLLLIVAALRMNTTLRELFLADNRFSPLDALQIANLLKFNRILQLLDIRNNPIQDMGLGHLCAGLMAQSGTSGLNGPTGGLNTLVLWNNQISHEGMAKLAMALRYTVSLSTLNLGQNVLGDDGILRLKEGLLQNHSLLRLGLVGTKLTDEGAVAIAEYLAESPRIIRLDLRNNDIRVAGLMALSLAFKINNSLLRLDIDKPNKKDSLKELAAKQESLLNDMISYAARNKQAALEKAQAAQQRQEQARRAEANQESGLRYMDMTNASTSPSTSSSSTEQASSNNSNNQSSEVRIKGHEFKGTEDQTTSRPVIAVAPDTDDTPEDSPEFLPRSSVSYHQVAPVMLSNSEMAKRAAAAAKLHPVVEHHEENLTPVQHLEAISKLVADVSHGPNETVANQPQIYTTGKSSLGTEQVHETALQKGIASEPLHEELSQMVSTEAVATSTDAQPNQDELPPEPNQSQASESQDQSTSIVQPTPTDVSELSPVEIGGKDSRHSTNAPDLLNTVGSEEPTSSADLHSSSNSDQSDYEKGGSDYVSDQKVGGQDLNAEQLSCSEVSREDDPSVAILGEGQNNDGHVSNVVGEVSREHKEVTMHVIAEGAKDSLPEAADIVVSETHQGHNGDFEDEKEPNQDSADADILALVSLASEQKTQDSTEHSVPNQDVLQSNQEELDEDEIAIKALVTMATESTSEEQYHSANVEHASKSPNRENGHSDRSIVQPTVVLTTKVDDDDVTTEESSGFENTAEDNSIQSGDLSPMLEDGKGSFKLLTPDSGIVHFDNTGPSEGVGPEYEKETIKNEKINESVGLGSLEQDSSVINSDSPSPESLINGLESPSTRTVNMALDLGKNSPSESHKVICGDFESQITAQTNENSPKTSENLTSEGAIQGSISKNIQKVLDSPCEVEVSHFDLNKFPSGD